MVNLQRHSFQKQYRTICLALPTLLKFEARLQHGLAVAVCID